MTVSMLPQLRQTHAEAVARHGEDDEESLHAGNRLKLALCHALNPDGDVDPATGTPSAACVREMIRYQEEMIGLTRRITDALTRRHGALDSSVFTRKDQLAAELFLLSNLHVGMLSSEALTESITIARQILDTLPIGNEQWIVQIRGNAKLHLGCYCNSLTINDVDAGKHLMREAIQDIQSVHGEQSLTTRVAVERVASTYYFHGLNAPTDFMAFAG